MWKSLHLNRDIFKEFSEKQKLFSKQYLWICRMTGEKQHEGGEPFNFILLSCCFLFFKIHSTMNL